MCWRRSWELDYERYYIGAKNQEYGKFFYEEVPSLRGIDAFNKKNKPLIKSEMEKEREKIQSSKLTKK
jgi:hypothetical protein